MGPSSVLGLTVGHGLLTGYLLHCPHHPLIMSGIRPCIGGSPATCLTWGLAELCLFRLFSKQSKHVTDGGGSCLKTPSEAGIERLGGCHSSLVGPTGEAGLMGITGLPSKEPQTRTFLPLHPQSQIPGLGPARKI